MAEIGICDYCCKKTEVYPVCEALKDVRFCEHCYKKKEPEELANTAKDGQLTEHERKILIDYLRMYKDGYYGA